MRRLPDPMDWLRQGIPLTLLIDLLDPVGPDSRVILVREEADLSWLPQHRVA